MDEVLVIKHGALGDFVLATGAFQAIRRHHAGDRLTLLTTAPLAALAEASGWFDAVWIDPRAPLAAVGHWLPLVRRLRQARFARVYDLQHSHRTHAYFRLMGRPPWSGIAPGCSHPHANPSRDAMHTLEREAEQLAMAGIAAVPAPDLSWARASLDGFALPERFALLVPGGSAHRPEKRWPAARFAQLADWLAERGLTPLLIGGEAERATLAEIARGCPAARDLGGRTDLFELAELGRRARLAIGNDTGPMHLVSVAGAPVVVLYSAASDPALTRPRGPLVTVLREPRLADLAPERVMAAAEELIGL